MGVVTRAAILSVGLTICGSVAALAADTNLVEIVSSPELSVTLTNPSGEGELRLAIRNSDTQNVPLSIAFRVPGRSDQEVAALVAITPSEVDVPAGSVAPLSVMLQRKGTSGTLTGFLIVSGTGHADAVPLTVSTGLEPAAELPVQIVILAFVFGVLVVGVAAATVKGILRRLSKQMGNVGWSFSDSWATNLTAIGALLGTVASAGFLPAEPMLLTKEAFAGLSLFFGLVVVLAPFLYVATASLTKADDGSQRRDGRAIWFILSASLTLSAVVGELLTLYVLLRDGFLRGTSETLVDFVGVVIGFGAFLVVWHAWKTIRWTINAYAPLESNEGVQDAAAAPRPRISLL